MDKTYMILPVGTGPMYILIVTNLIGNDREANAKIRGTN